MSYGTDYDLPHGWEAMSADELNSWFEAERCRRQALRQNTRFASKLRETQRREQRKAEARNTAYIGSGPWDVDTDTSDASDTNTDSP